MLRRLLASIREGDSFFDVGANIGTITLPVAVAGAAECLAFEPEPVNAGRLAANAELNRLANVTVIEAAVWSAPGTVGLRAAGRRAAGPRAWTPRPARAPMASRRSRSTPSPATAARRRTCVKIDVEGAELEVLRGAAGSLRSGRIRDLFVETHPGAIAARGGRRGRRRERCSAEHGYARGLERRGGTARRIATSSAA